MPFNYAPLKSSSARLIDRFGYDVTIVRGATVYPVRIVMINYLPTDIDGELIKQTDRKALLAGKDWSTGKDLTFTPNPETDKLHDGANGKLLRIVNVTPTAPAGEGDTLVYELQLRR